MGVVALVLSGLALVVSGAASVRQLRLARHANTLPVLVDLFREHRSDHLATARLYVFRDLPHCDPSAGLAGLPQDKQELVRDLAWYYDNLGALVTHGVVDLGPVSGYLGGSVINMWEGIAPFIEAERAQREAAQMADIVRPQVYFENLYHLVRKNLPATARAAEPLWRLPSA
ncbi:hypothetical protein ACFW6V_17220 [Streptomyces sp. NPDC058734]|uniref:DUF4760 domain-containing protein n=1 Tax=Streptomyces sp. NPDC058734 TaxID=3346615 RepID=UPI0036AF24D3